MPDRVIQPRPVEPLESVLLNVNAVISEAQKLSNDLRQPQSNASPAEQEDINDRLVRALSILRGESPSGHATSPTHNALETVQFEVVFDGKYSKLEARPGIHGKWELCFTLRRGPKNLELARDELSEAMKSAPNYPEHGFDIQLSGNNDLPSGRDISMTYTPVIRDSGGRVREGTDPKHSHEGLLVSMQMDWINNDMHRLACAAMRVKYGFPEDPKKIGSKSDEADLNEGMIVSTTKGIGSRAVSTSPKGIRGRQGWDDSYINAPFVVGGTNRTNL